MNGTARVALLGMALLALPVVARAQAPSGAVQAGAAGPHAAAADLDQSEQARIARAKAASEAAIQEARASGDVSKEAEALANLGSVYMMTGYRAKGVETLNASADLYARIGNDEMAQKLRKLTSMAQGHPAQ